MQRWQPLLRKWEEDITLIIYRYKMIITDANGQDRENVVIEPTNPNGRWICAIHGGYGSPDQMRVTTQLEVLFPNHHILFPKGDAILPDGQGGFALGWRLKDEEKIDNRFLADSLEQFLKAYDLSYKDGCVLGVSNGAMAGMRLLSHIDEMNINSFVGISGTYNSPETFDFKGRVLMINHSLDTIVPKNGNATYNSVTETLESMFQTCEVVETVNIIKSVSDPDYKYHNWDELNAIYPLAERIQFFVGI